MSTFRNYLVLLFSLLAYTVHAQHPFEKCQLITPEIRSISDSLTILPASIRLQGKGAFHFNAASNSIQIDLEAGETECELCYQTLASGMHLPVSARSMEEYDSTRLTKQPVVFEPGPTPQISLFKDQSIRKTGVVNRGISVGSNQDVFVNSELSLKLEGEINQNLYLEAELNDQNIPYEPEGNTQYLQDFDKVLINLSGEKYRLSAGDLQFRHDHSHFMKYNRNVQGSNLVLNLRDSIGNGFRSSAGYSVTRGKYAIQNVIAEDGIQGPYRLRGAGQERYIMVIAGSEKVYLDGELVHRGFEEDYTIDYNQAEITFTATRLITRFTRIRIEFEYTNFDYSRVSSFFQGEWQKKPFNFGVGYWMEKDNPQYYRGRLLDMEERNILATTGPFQEQVLRPGIDSTGYQAEGIYYKKELMQDSEGGLQEIFVYSNNPDSAHFQLTFNEVGPGQGDYVFQDYTARGKIYQWISPRDGISRGSYAPVVRMTTPQKQTMLVLRAGYALTSRQQVSTELAFTGWHPNLFASSTASMAPGTGFKIEYTIEDEPLHWLGNYRLNSIIRTEITDREFKRIDNYRSPEFDREWNTVDTLQAKDAIFNFYLGLHKDQFNSIGYKLTGRSQKDATQGISQDLNFKQQVGQLELDGHIYRLDHEQFDHRYNWNKISLQNRFRSAFLIPGYRFELQQNNNRFTTASFTGQSANFHQHQFFLQSPDSAKHQLKWSYLVRKDDLRPGLENSGSEVSKILKLDYEVHNDHHELRISAGYRAIQSDSAESQLPQRAVLGSLNWKANFFKRNLDTEFTYGLSSGRELKREFIFFQVPVGEGTHTWRDINQDGKQDLNEFYLAINNDERNYVKIFTPSDSYLNAYQNDFSYTLRGKFPYSWRGGGLFADILSRLSFTGLLKYAGKTSSTDLESRLLTWLQPVDQENILSSRLHWQSRLFFNRDSRVFALEGGYTSQSGKQLYTHGFEEQALNNLLLAARIQPASDLQLEMNYQRQNQDNRSEVVSGQDYSIDKTRFSPELKWQVVSGLRVNSGFSHTYSVNPAIESEQESAIAREVNGNVNLTLSEMNYLRTGFRMVDINFTGIENTAAGYQLLDGLRPGVNFTWNCQLQKKMLNGLYLNFFYEGRKSEYRSAVHFGKVQVQALF